MKMISVDFVNAINEYFKGISNKKLKVSSLNGECVYKMTYENEEVNVKSFYQESSYGHDEFYGWKIVEPKTKEVIVWE